MEEELKRINCNGKELDYVVNRQGKVFKLLKSGKKGIELSVQYYNNNTANACYV